jgi:hypothetical protein
VAIEVRESGCRADAASVLRCACGWSAGELFRGQRFRDQRVGLLHLGPRLIELRARGALSHLGILDVAA